MQPLLSDIEALLEHALYAALAVDPKTIRDHAVILIVPDFYERVWVKEWVQLLLRSMGFARACVLQVNVLYDSVFKVPMQMLNLSTGIARCELRRWRDQRMRRRHWSRRHEHRLCR
jgi:hypothetical protein